MTKLETKIKKLNTAYRKASPARRRVMIAKDALGQIKARKFVPVSGLYVKAPNCYVDPFEPLQPVLLSPDAPVCDCCAKGAIFLSYVRLANNHTGSPHWIAHSDLIRTIGKQWPRPNLNLIERYFEDGDGSRADDRKRMLHVLNNVIKNKGTFKP